MRRWDGDGEFDCDIVGESFYQSALEQLAGGRSGESVEIECEAVLRPDNQNSHDANAVAVEIGGAVVGHLSRDSAAAYRRLLRTMGMDDEAIACDALIIGGWQRRGGSGHFGVKLDFNGELEGGWQPAHRPSRWNDGHEADNPPPMTDDEHAAGQWIAALLVCFLAVVVFLATRP
jgi:hypothetical protein